MKGALAVVAVCLFPTIAVPAAGQEAAESTAVAAGLQLTWDAVRKFVKDNPNARVLQVIEEGPTLRHGRWTAMIPSSDFRGGTWATCQSGADAAIAPRQGRFDVEVRGDSLNSTVAIRASWSGQDPSQPQVPMRCASSGEFERDALKTIRERAEKEQKKKNK